MEEIWKDIVGYEGLYQVSNLGRVKRLYNSYHKTEEHILKPSLSGGNGKGEYQCIQLCKNSKTSIKYIHRLVTLAFIPNPDNKYSVDHINQNKLDNNVSNLRWATRREQHLNKTHKICKSGERYITKDRNSYVVRRYKRVNGKSTTIIQKSFPTLSEAIEFRNNMLANIIE